MAVQHPVAWIICDELYISRLCDADEHCIARHPGGLGNSAAFRSSGSKGVAVQMDRMVIHTEVDHANSNAIPETNDERSRRGTGLSVQDEPVEFHVHAVRHSV